MHDSKLVASSTCQQPHAFANWPVGPSIRNHCEMGTTQPSSTYHMQIAHRKVLSWHLALRMVSITVSLTRMCGLQVRSELRGYAKLPAWGAASPNPSLNLPSFSAYPQVNLPPLVELRPLPP